MSKSIFLTKPRGFCAGVIRAIQTVEEALKLHGPPIYVLRDIVHNTTVTKELAERGVCFVSSLSEIPIDAITVFSAHGVGSDTENQAKTLKLQTIDATCPLVKKVHNQAKDFYKSGRIVILVGHRNHPEVIGTMNRIEGAVYVVEKIEEVNSLPLSPAEPIAYITQTTLSIYDTWPIIEALQQKFSDIVGPGLDDICYATQNRQKAVQELLPLVQSFIIIGSKHSSNTNRLFEIAQKLVPSYMIDDPKAIQQNWFENIQFIGITAGASAPEVLVQNTISHLKSLFPIADKDIIEFESTEEKVHFALPVRNR